MNTGRPLGLPGSAGDDASSVANRTPSGVRGMGEYFSLKTSCLISGLSAIAIYHINIRLFTENNSHNIIMI